MKRTTLFILLVYIPLTVFPFYFKHIGIREGLAQLSVLSIYQDDLGRMWFGTNEGLSIYDGEKITTYKTIINPKDPANSNEKINLGNQIYAIVADAQGDIYLRIDYSLLKYDIYQERFFFVSDRRVTALASLNGEIWFAKSDSVFRYNKENDKKEFMFQVENSRTINAIHQSKDRTLWIAAHSGLYRMDESGEIACIIPHKDIQTIFESSAGEIWVGCRMEGMYHIDREGTVSEFSHDPNNSNSIASNQVRTFLEGENGEIWIGTFKGLQKYDPLTKQYVLFAQNKLVGGLAHSSIFSLYKDKQGTIWVGSYYGGVNYFNPEKDIFAYYTDNPDRDDCLSYAFVGSMTEDRNGNIWICTEGGGLNMLDKKSGKFRHFYAGQGSNSLLQNNLKVVLYDTKRHSLYIGTHTGGLSKYDIGKNRFTNYLHVLEKSKHSPNDIIHDLQLYNDSLIILARNGLFIMDLTTEKTKLLFPEVKTSVTYGTSCFIDSKGYIWILQVEGLLRTKINDVSDLKVYTSGEKGLGNTPITRIIETTSGEIYVGTKGSGVFHFNDKTDTFTGFTVETGDIISNYCYNIAETHQGNLIITHDKGVTLFNPQKGLTEPIELADRGLLITAIYESCGLLVCSDKQIFVGGADGLSSFFEEDLQHNEVPYNIYFSELYVSNKKIVPNDAQRILTQALPYTSSIILNHKQNNLTLRFASNNYVGALQNSVYEYQLEGFDKEWIETDNNSLYYTNLNPGKYILKVREKSLGQHRTPQEITLGITINKPFYTTTLAYLLYAVLIISIVSAFVYSKYSKMKLAASLVAEKKEKEYIEELNQSKLRFFTNISHEFRTPLTLIISQMELLLQNTSLNPFVYNKIVRIYKHTHHMRHLINELLDFRKIDQKHTVLNVSEQDIVALLKDIYMSFYEFASSHHINYQFNAPGTPLLCWFDPKQLQKVFYNILSNAFKYTEENGCVEINATKEEDTICIKIIDDGVGIEQSDIDKVFDRFYQANTSKDTNMGGTGIGLALVKSIVERHHGSVSVESRLGYGSIFCIRLKTGTTHFASDNTVTLLSENQTEEMQSDTLPNASFIEQILEKENILTTQPNDEEHPTILIVEDNEELLHTLSEMFKPLYHTILARNGEEGLQKAIEEMPELIISDVMMPVMTGTEMCLRIKNNLNTCHIPVVLLTALTSSEQNLEGLQYGADDYIGKPFNAKLLLLRCNNLIRNWRLRQKKYQDRPELDSKYLATNQMDKEFMKKVETIIRLHIDNPDFDVQKLAEELALGRSTLFAKFKGLTGMTPNEFIINYKLKQASILLKTHAELQISEISDQLGFSSPRYFSKCFKEQYAISPQEYRKKS